MKVRSMSIGVLLLALLNAGCGLFRSGTEVVSHRTWDSLEDCAEYRRNLRWAKKAWQDVCQSCAPHDFSKHYAKGFKEGFAELLYRGGCGEPPPVPPCEYRKLEYQTPEGYQAVLDWYAGYRHGAWVARQGGYRDLVTGPSALRAPGFSPSETPGPSGAEPPMVPAPQTPPMLPAPNEVRREGEVKPAGWQVTIDFAPWRWW